MIKEVLAGVVALGVAADVIISYRRVKKFGPQFEGNMVIRKAMELMGPGMGLLVSIAAPSAVVVGLSVAYFGLAGLAFVAGLKCHRALIQAESLWLEPAFEAAAKKFHEDLDKARAEATTFEQKLR